MRNGVSKAIVGIAIIAVAAIALGQTYTTAVYKTNEGDKMVVASGGEIEVQSGGTLDLQSGSTVTVTELLVNTDDIKIGDTAGQLDVGDGTAQAGIVNVKSAAATTITLDGASGQVQAVELYDGMAAITGGTATGLTVDGDDNTVQDLGYTVPKVLATVNDAEVGLPFILAFTIVEADLSDAWTVPTGKKIRVLDAWYVKTVDAGAAGDTVQVLNAAAGITEALDLNAVADTTRASFATIDDANYEVAAAAALTVTGVNGGGGCNAQVYVLASWVTP